MVEGPRHAFPSRWENDAETPVLSTSVSHGIRLRVEAEASVLLTPYLFFKVIASKPMS